MSCVSLQLYPLLIYWRSFLTYMDSRYNASMLAYSWYIHEVQISRISQDICNTVASTALELYTITNVNQIYTKRNLYNIRVHYPWLIVQILHGTAQLLAKPIKEMISHVLLDFSHLQHLRVFLLNHIQCPLQMGYRY